MFNKCDSSLPLDQKVANVLFSYRNTPHTTTSKPPAELFLRRAPRTRLSLVKPSLQSRVECRQEASKMSQDGPHPETRQYDLYQKVRVLNVRGGKEKWIPGTIVNIQGPNTYLVRVPGNRRRFVHADHLRHDDCEDTVNIKVGEIVRPSAESGANANVPTSFPYIPTVPRIPSQVTSPKATPPSIAEKCKPDEVV